ATGPAGPQGPAGVQGAGGFTLHIAHNVALTDIGVLVFTEGGGSVGTVTVNFGDLNPTTVNTTHTNHFFEVSATHTYTVAGTYSVIVTTPVTNGITVNS